MKNYLFVLALLLVPFLKAEAQYEEGPNPGNTGAHAFLFIDHATDAEIGEHVIIDVQMDGGQDNLGNFQGTVLRLKIPFSDWIEIEADMAADNWQVTDEVVEKYGLATNGRIDGGDPIFKTKMRILNETDKRPAISLQTSVKTASGDFKGGRRFTDSAGYEISILGTKTLLESDEAIIRKAKLFAEIAFIAWDTNASQQNDAWKISTALKVEGETFKMK